MGHWGLAQRCRTLSTERARWLGGGVRGGRTGPCPREVSGQAAPTLRPSRVVMELGPPRISLARVPCGGEGGSGGGGELGIVRGTYGTES